MKVNINNFEKQFKCKLWYKSKFIAEKLGEVFGEHK